MSGTETPVSRPRQLEQARAQHAWACVRRLGDQTAELKKSYGSLARSAPADIQAVGLGQTLAFWRAKGYQSGQPHADSAHARLYADLAGWLQQQLGLESNDILAWITEKASSSDYRRATAEALAWLGWLKRFAEAELPREEP